MWKWIAGRTGTSAASDLNKYVKNEKTLFNYVLHNEKKCQHFAMIRKKASVIKRVEETDYLMDKARIMQCL